MVVVVVVVLQTVEREMFTQGRRLQSLHDTAEQLIRDADYRNSAAKNIRGQLKDFDECWDDINRMVQERKEMVSEERACADCLDWRVE